uniref:Uncharacterized protein n=1 Tax=Physcomitrium patens TaxID=3218 RepID=A0A2K1JNX7_PHYPA|nr:hypothetical protein PHYPA_015648 [Physcomitrium patens]
MPTTGVMSSSMLTSQSTGNLIQSGAGIVRGINNMMPTSGSNSNVLNTMGRGAGIIMPTPGTSSNMRPILELQNMWNMSGSTILPFLGVSSSNPSLGSQHALGNARMAQNGHIPSSLGMKVGSQMIPTPELNSSQGMEISIVSSAGLGLPHAGVGTGQLQQQQQQQFGVGAGNHKYVGMSGQLNGGLISGAQQQKPGSTIGKLNGGMNNRITQSNGQLLMNGTANLHTPTAYLNTSQYPSLHHRMYQQQVQQLQQQQQQHQRPQTLRIQSPLPNPMAPRTGNSYAMNATDLAGGSFPSAGLASNNLGMTSIANSQVPKMIPVPGLPSQQTLQQQELQHQQAIPQQHIQQCHDFSASAAWSAVK